MSQTDFIQPVVYGFTGTQAGMTPEQQAALRRVLLGVAVLHHGDCVGADEQAHYIAGSSGVVIVIHPPTNSSKRAWCSGQHVRTLDPRPYMTRNHAIVDACSKLVAAPKSLAEVLRSGTWATVRYARKIGTPVILLAPDRSVQEDRL